MKRCLFDKTADCRFAPCTEAQGVLCCGACPFGKSCRSGCEKPKKPKETKCPDPVDELDGQIKLEV